MAQRSASLTRMPPPPRRCHPRSTRGPAPERVDRASFHESVRTARGDDPVGPVHRCACEPGHASRLRPLSVRARSGWRRSPSDLELLDPADRVLPREGTQPDRHGRRPWSPITAARFPREHGSTWSRCPASDARPPTSSVATPFGLPGLPGRSPRAARRQPPRPRQFRQNPEVVEAALGAALPPARWTRASDTLILHGRRICRPKPLCDRCQVRARCRVLPRSWAPRRWAERRPLPRQARAPRERRNPHETR